MLVDIRSVTPEDQPWIRDLLFKHFASPRVVSRGVLHQADELPGLVALREGSPIGVLLYDLRGNQCEVVVLIALEEGRGVATALLEAVKSVAIATSCRRIWLITTNDNTPAINFYQRRGWTRVACHYGAVAESRKLKPELPEIGRGGIPIRDEIEFEFWLCAGGA
jgi:GNAT superfamily N-acetyltransferase